MDNFDRINCWYNDVCNWKLCSLSCIRYQKMGYLFSKSNIPKNKWMPFKLIPENEDKKSFDALMTVKNGIAVFVTSGKNLYLHSKHYGVGKTLWSIKLLQSYFNSIWLDTPFTCRGLFISVPSFLIKYKANFNKSDIGMNSIVTDIEVADVVVWDDIGAGVLSSYDYGLLLSYVDGRLLAGKSNIFTGNLSGTELTESVGGRLSSRVFNLSLCVEFMGKDRRHN